MSSTGFVYADKAERACQFIFPPKTREDLARRHLETEVPRWVDRIEKKEFLVLDTDIDIRGPYFCPWVETYGDDMWIATGRFRSRRMREVDEDFLWASQELATNLGVKAPKRFNALPRDFDQQMDFVKNHPQKVWDDMKQVREATDAQL